MRKLPVLFLILSCLSNVLAQKNDPELGIDVTIRPRTEFRNGAFTLKTENDDPAYFISQRSRLRIQFGIEKLDIGFGAQNIRVWGASGQIAPNEGNNTMIHEAWAQYEFFKDLYLKVGRQDLVYDDDRILGSLDWHQAGRWHDLALLKFEPERHTLHLGLAYSQDAEYKLDNYYSSPGNNYKTMVMAWYEYLLSDNYKFSLLFLNTGFQVQADSSMEYMQTMGANFYKTGGPLNFTATFYYQGGENRLKRNVSAYLASIYGSYRMGQGLRLHFGTDYLTGDDMNSTDFDNTSVFEPLYGTNHKFYGFMDYFYVGVPHSSVGLWDKYLGLSYVFSPQYSMKIQGHHFDATGQVYATEELDPYLGTEIDLTFNWVMGPNVKLVGGYSQMFASESMEVAKGRGDHTLTQNWIWGMLVVNARIFDLDWIRK